MRGKTLNPLGVIRLDDLNKNVYPSDRSTSFNCIQTFSENDRLVKSTLATDGIGTRTNKLFSVDFKPLFYLGVLLSCLRWAVHPDRTHTYIMTR